MTRIAPARVGQYLFYVSVENTIAPGYVTEKFFQAGTHNKTQQNKTKHTDTH